MVTVDLHVHTVYSHDGYLSLPALDAACRRKGLTAVAVTDHDAILGGLEAHRRFRAGKFQTAVIVGEEVTTCQGEIVGLFLQEYIAPGMTLRDTMDAIHEQNGLVYLNHPFGYDRRSKKLSLPDLDGLWDRIDVVEIFNGRNWSQRANIRATRLAWEHGKPGGVGTDAHSAWEVGRSFVRMGAFDGPQGFLASLPHARHCCRPCPHAYRFLFKIRKMVLARPRPDHLLERGLP
jgi:predicted metal-dependent phosphoesterase TrpH